MLGRAGFKHKFELSCLSCAFGSAKPDGRFLREKILLRSTNIRAQAFLTAECNSHVHAHGWKIRRSCYTGVDQIIRMVACDMRDEHIMLRYGCPEMLNMSVPSG